MVVREHGVFAAGVRFSAARMKKVILLNKKEGETPLAALMRLRSRDVRYKDVKMAYAGRLDPMASGLLLILLGEEVKKKEKYLKLSKEYEFEMLFGFATDTYDILGKITSSIESLPKESELKNSIKRNLLSLKGRQIQKYPLFSSKTVKGKPLFTYAREGREVEAPEREIYVKKLKFVSLKEISGKKLLKNIEKRIDKVEGDFRQKEILGIWRKGLTLSARPFYFAKLSIECGSGTYVRGIANELGERMGIPALAYSIKRTRIGKWCKM